ncbi:hypothetical protein [Nonomuraea sp. SYSU D8015]|uniref:hypothetical protein n=1 Tax=Nonomuraea sp. SYSU D8015 TaxID=2593644 RepID=UPI001660E4DA|nr:hypothetical protein [Nonomuraea sp. SYSU D8015]
MTELPRKPKLHPGLSVLPYERGLLVEGTAEQKVFGGPAARTFLPRLLPLLDGTRTREDLAGELGHHMAEAIAATLRLLHTTGHLQEGDGDPALPAGVPPGVAQAVGRMLGTTMTWPNVEAAFQALHASPVLIADTGAPAERVAELLAASGDRVTLLAPDHVPAAGEFVVVASAGEADADVLEQLDAACFDRGAIWLRARLAGDVLQLGPCFDRRFTPCLACFHAAVGTPAEGPPDAALAELAWAIVAGEVFHQRARVGTPLAADTVATFGLRAWSLRQDAVVRRADCDRCGTAA